MFFSINIWEEQHKILCIRQCVVDVGVLCNWNVCVHVNTDTDSYQASLCLHILTKQELHQNTGLGSFQQDLPHLWLRTRQWSRVENADTVERKRIIGQYNRCPALGPQCSHSKPQGRLRLDRGLASDYEQAVLKSRKAGVMFEAAAVS